MWLDITMFTMQPHDQLGLQTVDFFPIFLMVSILSDSSRFPVDDRQVTLIDRFFHRTWFQHAQQRLLESKPQRRRFVIFTQLVNPFLSSRIRNERTYFCRQLPVESINFSAGRFVHTEPRKKGFAVYNSSICGLWGIGGVKDQTFGGSEDDKLVSVFRETS